MLYQLLYSWADQVSAFNLFRYITVRTFISFFTAFLMCWIWGPAFIRRLVEKQWGQRIRNEGPASHQKKAGTPTMGGALILFSTLIPCLFWTDLRNPYVVGTLMVCWGFGLVGYVDDWLKISKKNTKGLPGKIRLGLEFFISAIVLFVLISQFQFSTEIFVPFFKNISIDLGYGYILFGSLVIVGTANAVNLTDGLDGLVIVPFIVCATTLAIFAYVTGHAGIAHYLQIPHVAGVGELAVVGATFVASGLGFLWFNSHPAQVFMGDIGSLSLGGLLGTFAVFTHNEILMIVLGGIFVIEALSVITQVISFKTTGKRIFKMAPLHHHFELNGFSENKIIVRFWIISILLAVLCLSTLKLR